jgi:hypothetical protein
MTNPTARATGPGGASGSGTGAGSSPASVTRLIPLQLVVERPNQCHLVDQSPTVLKRYDRNDVGRSRLGIGAAPGATRGVAAAVDRITVGSAA